MKSYILLRKNRESGPYTLREMKKMNLYETDLIWIEGESTSWKYPTEFEELKNDVKPPEEIKTVPQKSYTASTKKETVSVSESTSPTSASTVASPSALPVNDFYTSNYYEELKNNFSQQSTRRRRRVQFDIGSNLIGVTVFIIGLFMIAVMVKKAVDNINNEQPLVATAEAHELISEKMPVSNEVHQAKTTVPVTQNAGAVIGALPKQTTKSNTKIAPGEVADNALPVNSDEPTTPPATQETDKTVTANTASAEPEVKDDKKNKDVKEGKEVNEAKDIKEVKEEAKPDKVEKPVSKPSLQLVANDFKVGLLGGIKNLALVLTNPSAQTIDKASVEVEYLKPNGKVVNTQNFDVFDIAPGGSKKIVVPDNSRGVNVHYRVTNIDAHGGKIAQKNT